MADPDSEEKARALWHWVQRLSLSIDNRFFSDLLEDLQSKDWGKVADASRSLGKAGPDLLWPMVQLLESPERSTRWGALMVLETMGPAARLSFERIKALLPHSLETYGAARTIASFEGPKYLEYLQEQIQSHHDRNIRRLILRGLSGNKTRGASLLGEYLDHDDPTFVYEAMEELSFLKGAADEQVPKILTFVNSANRPLRKLARRALKRIMCS